MKIYHLCYLDSEQTGLLILKGVCCQVSNAKADNLGREVVFTPLVENYSLFACLIQFTCEPRRCKSLNTICLRYLDFPATR